MPNYIAKIKVGAKLESIPIIAESEIAARELGARHGKVMSVRKASALSNTMNRGMNTSERIVFLRRLSTMVRSRVGLGESLKIMQNAFNGPVGRAANELIRSIEAGASFGDAVVSMPKDFPQTTAALIRAGIKAGDIYAALEDAAQYEMEMETIRRESGKGLLSAVGSFLIAAVIILGTSTFVGPYVMESQLIKAAGDSVNVDWVFSAATVISYIMIAITAVFVCLMFLTFVIKPLFPTQADKIILRIPVYRDLILAQNNYTVFYGMALLARSGVRMEDVLSLSRESAPPGEAAEDLGRALTAVRSGLPWATAMRNLHPTDKASLSTAQDREQVGVSLSAVSRQYKDSYTRRVQQVIPILQMVSALFMSIGGALIFGMVIMPMLQMTSGLM